LLGEQSCRGLAAFETKKRTGVAGALRPGKPALTGILRAEIIAGVPLKFRSSGSSATRRHHQSEAGMKSFLRENPTIAFGLGLPLLLVVVFLLVSGIPALLVDPPRYDVLYATEIYNYPNGLQISVVNHKVQVVYQGNTAGYQKPRLWRYNPGTGGVQEIPIMLPPGLLPPGQKAPTPAEAARITAIDVPDLAGLAVDPSSVAPDGYEFSAGPNGYSGDVFSGLFYARYRNDAVLTKKGRSIRLPNAGNSYYSSNTRFIGWVVSP
jgi:hypothetical protein